MVGCVTIPGMSEEDAAWVKLGSLVKRRMADLRVKPKRVEELGGPKPTKLRELANGRARTLRDGLKPGLEDALDWMRGSIDDVLAGLEPTPIEQPAQAAPAASPLTYRYLEACAKAWDAVQDLVASLAEEDQPSPILEKASLAIAVTADTLSDILVSSPDAPASKDLLARIHEQWFQLRAVLNEMKEKQYALEDAAAARAQAALHQKQKTEDADLASPEVDDVALTAALGSDVVEDLQDLSGLTGSPGAGRDVTEGGPDTAAEG